MTNYIDQNFFKNKIALVTGGATGIGKSIALSYANAGATVVISDVLDDKGKELADIINHSNGTAKYFHCDVGQSSDIENLMNGVVSEFGRIDVACNNAGIEGETATTIENTIENWDNVINVNLKGVWLCMKFEISHMLDSGGGSIINLSSIAGTNGFEDLSSYVASKHGVIGLTKCAALENADKNIRINAICPGPIKTDMLSRIMSKREGFEKMILENVPMNRMGEPEEIGGAALFLSSPMSSFITGQSVTIDGGWTAK